MELSVAIGRYGSTAALLDGEVPIQGVRPEFYRGESIIAAYRRMVREEAFDICELAPTTYLMAREAGARFRAIPAFLMRHFHHSGIICQGNANIRAPADLHGRRVGVRAWSVTTGVWIRGLLAEEYGVRLDWIRWIVDDEEHVASFRLPGYATQAPPGQKLRDMFATGELDAGIAGNAGIGAVRPAGSHELFPDAAERDAEWFVRTGIYPVHALVVIRERLLAEHPWLAGSVFEALAESRRRYVERLARGLDATPEDRRYQAIGRIVGDPLPFGLGPNRVAMEKLVDHALAQNLIARRPKMHELFIDVGI